MEENATVIEHLLIDPNPVSAGDTAKITCVIRDSLETGFDYNWTLSNASNLSDIFNTETCETEWIAPDLSRIYNHSLRVNRVGYRAVTKEFSITVTED